MRSAVRFTLGCVIGVLALTGCDDAGKSSEQPAPQAGLPRSGAVSGQALSEAAGVALRGGSGYSGTGSIRAGGMNIQLSCKAQPNANGVDLQIAADTQGARTEYVQVAGQVWFKDSEVTPAWTQVTPERSKDPVTALVLQPLPQIRAGCNVPGLLAMAGKTGSWTASDGGTIAGGPATKYSAAVPAVQIDAFLRDGAPVAPPPANPSAPPTQVELWLDQQNRPVRLVAKADAAGTPAVTSVDYTGWGQSVQVAPPSVSTAAP